MDKQTNRQTLVIVELLLQVLQRFLLKSSRPQIFYSLILGSNTQRPTPKWYNTSHNHKKCSHEKQFFEASFTEHKLSFKRSSQHSNGKIHIIWCHWDVFHPFHAIFFWSSKTGKKQAENLVFSDISIIIQSFHHQTSTVCRIFCVQSEILFVWQSDN